MPSENTVIENPPHKLSDFVDPSAVGSAVRTFLPERPPEEECCAISVAPVSNRCLPPSEVEFGRPYEPQAQARGSSPASPLTKGGPRGVSSTSILHTILKRYWGADEFRPLQLEAIEAALRNEDSLVILPTGRGKSLCYQIPALLTPSQGRTKGSLTVVVCPLISLMKDQVDACIRRGIPAAFLNSQQSPREQEDVARRAAHGDLRLLYIAPERILKPPTLSMLHRIHSDGRLNAFVIDEAHCIASWGHDFRPDYQRLLELRVIFPRVRINAFTATATPQVRDQIIHGLALVQANLIIGDVTRPNLFLSVYERDFSPEQLLNFVVEHGDQAGIIYVPTRAETERIAAELLVLNFPAAAYHAGLDDARRTQVQECFMRGDFDVIVATVAFGMGIDRPDVRYVLHSSMPPSIDQYHQEIGRAGRDGKRADCVIFHHPHDVMRWDELFAASGLDDERLDIKNRHLNQMHEFCRDSTCRHAQLAAYFGQSPLSLPGRGQGEGSSAYEPQTQARGSSLPASDALCNACDVCMEVQR